MRDEASGMRRAGAPQNKRTSCRRSSKRFTSCICSSKYSPYDIADIALWTLFYHNLRSNLRFYVGTNFESSVFVVIVQTGVSVLFRDDTTFESFVQRYRP